jgi:hypothetical protein
MHPLAFVSRNWQKWLPVLILACAAIWTLSFYSKPTSEQSIFAAMLIVYMVHQVEEHLWPGGFRQFANFRVFKSGQDDWPVDEGGIALINVGYVWLPIALAAVFPGPLRWLGLCWIGGTLINAITHIAMAVRLRMYNPGLATSIVLFLPFTTWALWHEAANGALSAMQIAIILIAGVLFHVPVAALFVVPYLRAREAKAV